MILMNYNRKTQIIETYTLLKLTTTNLRNVIFYAGSATNIKYLLLQSKIYLL